MLNKRQMYSLLTTFPLNNHLVHCYLVGASFVVVFVNNTVQSAFKSETDIILVSVLLLLH